MYTRHSARAFFLQTNWLSAWVLPSQRSRIGGPREKARHTSKLVGESGTLRIESKCGCEGKFGRHPMALRHRGGHSHYRFTLDGKEYSGRTGLAATKSNATAAQFIEAE